MLVCTVTRWARVESKLAAMMYPVCPVAIRTRQSIHTIKKNWAVSSHIDLHMWYDQAQFACETTMHQNTPILGEVDFFEGFALGGLTTRRNGGGSCVTSKHELHAPGEQCVHKSHIAVRWGDQPVDRLAMSMHLPIRAKLECFGASLLLDAQTVTLRINSKALIHSCTYTSPARIACLKTGAAFACVCSKDVSLGDELLFVYIPHLRGSGWSEQGRWMDGCPEARVDVYSNLCGLHFFGSAQGNHL